VASSSNLERMGMGEVPVSIPYLTSGLRLAMDRVGKHACPPLWSRPVAVTKGGEGGRACLEVEAAGEDEPEERVDGEVVRRLHLLLRPPGWLTSDDTGDRGQLMPRAEDIGLCRS
jgi:hypothetical protein